MLFGGRNSESMLAYCWRLVTTFIHMVKRLYTSKTISPPGLKEDWFNGGLPNDPPKGPSPIGGGGGGRRLSNGF